MITGTRTVCFGDGKAARSRSLCPRGNESLTKPPAIARSVLGARPTSAADRNLRRSNILARERHGDDLFVVAGIERTIRVRRMRPVDRAELPAPDTGGG